MSESQPAFTPPVMRPRQYIDGVMALAKVGRSRALQEVLEARLKKNSQEVHDLVSPPLSRGDHDENGLLYLAYDLLQKEGHAAALEYLREATVEGLLAEFYHSSSDLSLLYAWGRLAAYFRVKESPRFAKHISGALWYRLENEMSKPFYHLMQLPLEEKQRATWAFDLILAMTPELPLWQVHQHKKLQCLWNHSLQEIMALTPAKLQEAHVNLFWIIFELVLQADPGYAAAQALPEVCGWLPQVSALSWIQQTWESLTWKYGMVFRQRPQWRKKFEEGLQNIQGTHLAPPLKRSILDTLQRLDSLHQHFEPLWLRDFSQIKSVSHANYNLAPEQLSVKIPFQESVI